MVTTKIQRTPGGVKIKYDSNDAISLVNAPVEIKVAPFRDYITITVLSDLDKDSPYKISITGGDVFLLDVGDGLGFVDVTNNTPDSIGDLLRDKVFNNNYLVA